MKNAIVQIYVSTDKYSDPGILPKFDELSEVSFALTKRYAKKIGAEYFLITEPRINYIHPTYERFTLFEDPSWTENFNNVLYLDSDIFIWDHAPDIFKMYPAEDKFKVCQHWDYVRYKMKSRVIDSKFNAGVFMLNKNSRNAMLPFLNYRITPTPVNHDNTVLVNCMVESKVEVEEMDARFNAKNSEDCFFCHTWGSGKRINPNMSCILKAKQEAINEI
jgi:hypothetical protein